MPERLTIEHPPDGLRRDARRGGILDRRPSFQISRHGYDLETLAEGLSEDIVTGLSRFSYLRVVSRSSTLQYQNETYDVRSVGKDLGVELVFRSLP